VVHAVLPPLPLLLEALSLTQGRPFHQSIFKGEFGFWEIGTVLLSLTACVLGLVAVFGRPRIPDKLTRVLLGILAVGCFYLAGEEASWGQHIFGWQAGGIWSEFNYQQETNLHNLKELSFTNQLPRLVVTFGAIACVFSPWLRRRMVPEERPKASRWHWLLPTGVCIVTALLVLLPPIPKKLGLPALPEPGETEEFYMALLLALYFASILIRKRSGEEEN
jgi:hypothetical protein